MTASLAIYKDFYGDLDSTLSFVLIADEDKVGILIPGEPLNEDSNEVRRLVGSRIFSSKEVNPEIGVEELLMSITYNLSIEFSLSEPFSTYEEAEKNAQQIIYVSNSFEGGPTYEVYEPIMPEGFLTESPKSEQPDSYVLVSDDEEVVGLFQNSAELGDVLRVDGKWGAPTFEQTEEWDGYEMVTIELRFVDVYDQMMADGEDVNLETIQSYITEQ